MLDSVAYNLRCKIFIGPVPGSFAMQRLTSKFVPQICQTLRLRLEQRVRQQRQRLQTSTTTATTTLQQQQPTQQQPNVANVINGGNVESQALIWDRQRSSVLRRNDARRERNIIR